MDEDEGQRSRHDHPEGKPLQSLNIDTAGVDVGVGEPSTKPDWYGVQEDTNPRQHAARRPWERTAGSAAAQAQAAAAGKKKGKQSGKEKAAGAKKSKSKGKATGRSKHQVNPSIGKSNLDAIIAQTREEAKKGAFAEAFGGERVDTAAPPVGAGVKQGAAERSSIFAGDAERAEAGALEAAAARARAEEIEAGEEVGVPYTMAGRWKKRVTFVVRTVQIWAFLFHVLVKLLRQKLVQQDEERMSTRRRKLGRYLCRAFLKLGPTFIKIGQVRCVVSCVVGSCQNHIELYIGAERAII